MFANTGCRLWPMGLLCLGLLSIFPTLSAQEQKSPESVSRFEQQMGELAKNAAPYHDKSIAQCRDAAKGGEPVAMLVLAQRLLNDRKNNEECPEAIEWLTRAAAKDFAPAIHRLGICHYHAVGTPENDPEAVACFRRAADAGFIPSIHKLGMCYHGGHGVKEDFQQAYQLFRKAAEAGEYESLYVVGVYFNDGVAVPQDQAEAIGWWEKAAAGGHLLACNNLGVAYLDGKGVDVDRARAIRYFREGALQGNSHCQCNLGRCYRDGLGAIQDFDTAEEWLQKSAAQKFQPAEEMLAELHSARAAARAEARARLFGRRNRGPAFPGELSDAEEEARRQMRDYQNQLGSGLP